MLWAIHFLESPRHPTFHEHFVIGRFLPPMQPHALQEQGLVCFFYAHYAGVD